MERASVRDKMAMQKVIGNGAVRLSDLEGNEFNGPINVDRLKLYIA